MKTPIVSICVLLLLASSPFSSAIAEAPSEAKASPSLWTEDKDGVMGDHEYRVVNAEGNLTRARCPYTCEDRGIARSNCKEWKSKDGDECYVQDTSKPQSAVPVGN